MTIKSIQTLVSDAMSEIKTISADEAYKLVEDNNCNLIDIREINELNKTLTGNRSQDGAAWGGFLSGVQFQRLYSGGVSLTQKQVSWIHKCAK